jgi:hypothetical protein
MLTIDEWTTDRVQLTRGDAEGLTAGLGGVYVGRSHVDGLAFGTNLN